jgi:hypothetical protein
MHAVKTCFALLCALMLSACGGGSSSKSADSETNGAESQATSANVTISDSVINIESDYTFDETAEFVITLKEVPEDEFFIYLFSDLPGDERLVRNVGYQDVDENSIRFTAHFNSRSGRAAGDYQETLTVWYCYDSGCNNPIEGAPLNVEFNLTLTEIGTLTSDTDSITVRSSLNDATNYPRVSFTLDVKDGTSQNYYFKISEVGGSLITTNDLEGTPPLTATVQFDANFEVGVGVHSTSLNIQACYDRLCSYPVTNEIDIPVEYVVSNDSSESGYSIYYTDFSFDEFEDVDIFLDSNNGRIINPSKNSYINIMLWDEFEYNSESPYDFFYFPELEGDSTTLEFPLISQTGTMLAIDYNLDELGVFSINGEELRLEYIIQDEGETDLYLYDFAPTSTNYSLIGSVAILPTSDGTRFWDVGGRAPKASSEPITLCQNVSELSSSIGYTISCDEDEYIILDTEGDEVTLHHYVINQDELACDASLKSITRTDAGFIALDNCANQVMLQSGIATRVPSVISSDSALSVIDIHNGAVLVRKNVECLYESYFKRYSALHSTAEMSGDEYVAMDCNEYSVQVMNEDLSAVAHNIPYSAAMSIHNGDFYVPYVLRYSEEDQEVYLIIEKIESNTSGDAGAIKIEMY